MAQDSLAGPDIEDRIAVVGMAGRFPGADSPAALWPVVLSGAEMLSRFTTDQLLADGVPPQDVAEPGYVPVKGVLADVAGFDATLFGYSALEAAVLDPQQRIFLEAVWGALEDAGCDPDRFTGTAAVFAGTTLSTYLINNLASRTDLKSSLGVPMVFQSNTPDGLAARAAYKFDLRGPAVTVMTACSSSLVAVHQAVQSLLAQECDLALAGGVSVTVPNRSGYLPEASGIESPSGRCRPFSADADGTVFGNGVGVVVLKRLADALADGDRVHAVILGSAVTNDGTRRAGYTAPGVAGQSAVIREALSMAGVGPRSIGYVEAHGTGTPVGDPIEVAALTAAYRAADPDSTERSWCALGSVKANLGHLDAAAGVTGLIKTVLVLGHAQIPPVPGAERPNPGLGLETGPFYLPGEAGPWPEQSGPRRAAVSSFGIGGTNAHVILEQAPGAVPARGGQTTEAQSTATATAAVPVVGSSMESAVESVAGPVVIPVALPLSARTESALHGMSARLADHLEQHPDQSLGDIARTLRTGRRHLPSRRVVLASDLGEAAAALRTGQGPAVLAAGADAPVGFLLPGQGAQFPGMAHGLYRAHPVFRAALDECARLLRPELGRDLLEVLDDEDALRRTSLVQPSVLAVSWALSRLWDHWGVRPRALLGHSLGEYTAALLAGVIELPDALALVAARGRLLDRVEPGGMVSLPLAEDDARQTAQEWGLELAAVNGPRSTVLSGAAADVDRAVAALADQGLHPLRLATDRPFHNSLCGDVAEELAAYIAKLSLKEPRTPFVSNVTGTWITAEQALDPGYWARHLLAPVRFFDGVRTLTAWDEGLVLVEIGPGRVLSDLLRASRTDGLSPARVARPPMPPFASRAGVDPVHAAVTSLADLWTHGATVAWEPLPSPTRVADLPGYPFEHRRHWIDPLPVAAVAAPAVSGSALAGGSAVASPTDVPEEAEPVRARVSWRPLPVTDADGDPFQSRRWTWLVLLDRAGTAQPFVDLLTARGQIVTVVQPGPEYRRVRRGVYELDPADPDQYNQLLADLRALVRTPTAVLYAWGLGSGTSEEPEEAEGSQGSDGYEAYFGLVRLVRALGAERVVNDVRIGVLSAGAFATDPTESADPVAALLSGPAMVIPEEYDNLHCTQVDLPPGGQPDQYSPAEVVGAVLAGPERLLALRDGRFLGRRTEQAGAGPSGSDAASQDAASQSAPGSGAVPAPLPQGGVYLITGGLGGIGLTLARWLADTVQARLVLLGRRTPEEVGEEALHALADLDAAGAEVLTVQADVADAAQVAAALDQARKRFGRVDAVVHAAGVPGGGAVDQRGDAEMRAVLAPKVDGLRNLLAALGPDEAGLLVLCSSLAALVPTYGQSDYAAANAYLAAAASAENAAGRRRAVAVDWDMWGETGMASRAQVPADLRDYQRAMLASALSAGQALRAFAALVAEPGARAVVARAGTPVGPDGAVALAAARVPTPAAREPRPDLATPYVAPRTETEERVAQIYCALLGMEEIGVHDDFLELGGHSLLAARIVARLRAEFGVGVPALVFFEGGRVADVAAEVEEQILAELEGGEAHG